MWPARCAGRRSSIISARQNAVSFLHTERHIHCRVIVPSKGIFPLGIGQWFSPTGHSAPFPLVAMVLAPALLLEGCAFRQAEDVAGEAVQREPRAVREHRLQTMWSGRPYNTLVETYGSPKLIMSVPGYRAVRTSVAVFGVIDKASDCIDAFTIQTHFHSGEIMVADYFCR